MSDIDVSPQGEGAGCELAALDDGIRLGAECLPSDNLLTVYLGVRSSAARKQRRIFKEMVEAQVAELGALVGQKLEGNETSLWAGLSTDIKVRADWPRQHQWIKITGEKFLEVFAPRLGIE